MEESIENELHDRFCTRKEILQVEQYPAGCRRVTSGCAWGATFFPRTVKRCEMSRLFGFWFVHLNGASGSEDDLLVGKSSMLVGCGWYLVYRKAVVLPKGMVFPLVEDVGWRGVAKFYWKWKNNLFFCRSRSRKMN